MRKRRALIWLACTLLALLACALTGCVQAAGEGEVQTPPPSPESYFAALEQSDMTLCYSMLSSAAREKITLADFTTKLQSYMDALELEQFTHTVAEPVYSGDGLACTYEAELGYYCAKVPDFTQSVSMRYVLEDGTWRLDWTPALVFTDLDWDDVVRVQTLKQKRGELLDAQGNCYAVNAYADTIYMRLSKVGDYATAARSVAALAGMTETDVLKIMTSERAQADDVAVITYYMPDELTAEERQAYLAISGVGINDTAYTPIRYYPGGTLMAHTIGYATVVTAEDLEGLDGEIYGVDSLVGRTGLEAAYESALCGKRGIELVIYTPSDASKVGTAEAEYKRKSVISRLDAVDGLDLRLTIDNTLQKRADSVMAEVLADTGVGSVVVLDPTTGAVLAASSYPTFDLNIFASKTVASEYKALLDDARSPLYNRTTRGLYAPGSTVKPIVGAMSIDSGKFTLATLFKGAIVKNQWLPTMSGWIYPPITRVSWYQEPYNMTNAVIHSDNIYFANVALNCGWSLIVKLYEKLGFGEGVDYDLPVSDGQVYSDSSQSNLRLLADMGYGQGELLVTPIQMASVYTLFRNDGDVYLPYIVSALCATEQSGKYAEVETYQPQVATADVFTQSTVDAMEDVLIATMNANSNVNISGITVAGKTGTAEVDENTEIAWLIAYVVDEGYERLVCVTLEVEPDGGIIRYDIAKALLAP